MDQAIANERQIAPRRARRLNLQPTFVAQEVIFGYRYPRRHVAQTPFGEVELRYRRSRRQTIGGHPDAGRKRELFCWLWLGKMIVGAIHMVEFDLFWETNYRLLLAMDDESSDAARLGEVLVESWGDLFLEVAAYGSVLEFGGLWLRREYAKGSWWVPIARDLIAEFEYAILVLRAFPLEYEARLGEDEGPQDAFEARTRAMMRHYRRLLGVQPFPGAAGADGWMWAPRPEKSAYIDPPGFYPLEVEE